MRNTKVLFGFFFLLVCLSKAWSQEENKSPLEKRWDQVVRNLDKGNIKSAYDSIRVIREEAIRLKLTADVVKSVHLGLMVAVRLDSPKWERTFYLEQDSITHRADDITGFLVHYKLAIALADGEIGWDWDDRDSLIQRHISLSLQQPKKLLDLSSKGLVYEPGKDTKMRYEPVLEYMINEYRRYWIEEYKLGGEDGLLRNTDLFDLTEGYYLLPFPKDNSDRQTAFFWYQYLEKQCRDNRDQTGLLFAQCNRLMAAKQMSLHPNSSSLFYEAGEQLILNNKQDTGVYEVIRLLTKASYPVSEWAQRKNRYLRELIDSSFADCHSRTMMMRVNQERIAPFLSLQINENRVEVPTLVNIRYKNFSDSLSLKVYRISKNVRLWKKTEGDDFSELIDYMDKRPLVHEVSYYLERPGKGETQSILIDLPLLRKGRYCVVLKTNSGSVPLLFKSFELESIPAKISSFTTTDQKYKSGVVTDIISGEPISSVPLKFRKAGTLQSDSNGIVDLSKDLEDHSYWMKKYKYEGRWYKWQKTFYKNRDWNKDEPKLRTLIKTYIDKPIYRLGQTIHFKALLYEDDERGNVKALRDSSLHVKIGTSKQLFWERYLSTDEFGTISDTFNIPLDAPSGEWYLRVRKKGTLETVRRLQVDQYKKQGASVELDNPRHFVSQDSTSSLKGMVSTNYGLPISGATVHCQMDVEFKETYDKEIRLRDIFDTTTTSDRSGKFEIPLKFPSVVWNQPVEFALTVTVTTPSGESIVLERRGIAGEIQLQDHLDIVPNRNRYKGILKHWLDVKVAKENIPFEGIVTVSSLPVKNTQGFDKVLMEEEVRIKHFPYETFPMNEVPSVKVISQTPVTSTHFTVNIPAMLREVEWYKVCLDVKKEDHSYQLCDSVHLLPTDQYLEGKGLCGLHVTKKDFTTDDTLEFSVTGTRDSLPVLVLVHSTQRDILRQWVYVSPKKTTFQLPLQTEDIGEVKISCLTFVNQQRDKQVEIVKVKAPHSQIRFKWKTFRQYLSPGEKEKWTLTFENRKEAEMALMASMYNYSLLDLRTYSWRAPYFAFPEFESDGGYGYGSERWTSPVGDHLRRRRNNYWPKKDVQLFMHSYVSGDYNQASYVVDGIISLDANKAYTPTVKASQKFYFALKEADVVFGYQENVEDLEIVADTIKAEPPAISIRKNLRDLAFFYPHILPGPDNQYEISFTAPEEIGKWRLLLLAHGKRGEFCIGDTIAFTTKPLMIRSIVTRTLREGDKIRLPFRLENLTDTLQNVNAQIQVKGEGFLHTDAFQRKVNSQSHEIVYTSFTVPSNVDSLEILCTASNAEFQDGEQRTIHVLPQKDSFSVALPIHGAGKKVEYEFRDLPRLVRDKNAELHSLSLNYSSSYVPLLLESLPYLKSYPHECAEQTFAKYFANAVALHLVRENPALISQIEEEQSGTGEHQLLALLDTVQCKKEVKRLKRQMSKYQRNFGYAWFPGWGADKFVSAHIIHLLGEMIQEGVVSKMQVSNLVRTKSIYDEIRFRPPSLEHLLAASSYPSVNDLVYRKAFKNALDSVNRTRHDMYPGDLARLALVNLRKGDEEIAKKIIGQLEEQSISTDEKGKYWAFMEAPEHTWYEPVEEMYYFIRLWQKSKKPKEEIDEMKRWLLNHRTRHYWSSTKSTTLVCMLLLDTNFDLTKENPTVIAVGKHKLQSDTSALKSVQQVWEGKQIDLSMKSIEVNPSNDVPGYGSVELVYHYPLEQITPSKGSLQVKKQLYDSQGELITPNVTLKVGDKVRARLIIEASQSFGYLHIEDQRAAALEPLQKLSEYFEGEDFRYYASVKDDRMDFYIPLLSKGTHVIEYDMHVTHAGRFENGIARIEGMYHSGFKGHSASQKVKVE